MNKIKKSIDDIKLNEKEKNKIFNNIIESKKENYSLFNFKSVIRFATIVLAIGIFSYTSVYAAAKIFNWNNKFLNFLGISVEEAENNNLKNTEIEKSIKIDDMNITVNQAAIFGNNIYVFLTYKFDTLDPSTTLDDLNNNKIDISIESEENIYRGMHNFINLESTTKEAIGVAELFIDEPIEENNNLKINFHTDFVLEELDSGESIGSFKTTNSMNLEVSMEQNDEYTFSQFDKELYLKNNEIMKIRPTKLVITPIDISLEINLYTDIEYPEDEELKFDNTLNINFKDGTTIKLDSVAQDGKLIQGSNHYGIYIDEEGREVKERTLTYSNIYSFDIYSKQDFSFINIDNIISIQIGDTVINR